MTRVLVIGMHDMIGGVETFLHSYYQHLDPGKIQLDFLSIYPKICFEDEFSTKGSVIHRVPDFKSHPIQYAIALDKILRENKYKIIHINMLSAANFIPILVAKWRHTPATIVHAHNTDVPSGFLRRVLHFFSQRICISMASHFWACSRKAGLWFFGEDIANSSRFALIQNAVNVPRFLFNPEIRNRVRKDFNLEGKFVIGHVGRFQLQKNHSFVVDVFASVLSRNPNAVLLLVGDGELRSIIEHKVKSMGLNDDSILFLGIRNDVNELFQGMDVFLFPSLFEGLGIVGIEAQIAGLPVVASDVIPEEMDITGKVSFLSLNQSVEDWAHQILSQNTDDRFVSPDLIRQKGYDVQFEARRLGDLYQGTLHSL